MNPEHPPLAKLLAALPLLALHPRMNTSDPSWAKGDQVAFGFTFLYGNDADRLLFWSRAAMIALAAVGAAVTFLWARDLFGGMAGIFALSLYVFCPNILAHGMLVTTDVPVTVFTILTLYLFWKRGERPTWQSDIVTGLALGAAMASKFSGAILPIVLFAFCLVRREIRSLLLMALASLLVIQAAYLFSASPLLYFRNMRFVGANHLPNYPFYLFGKMKPGGWWYYFPVAFALKATLPSVLLIFFAAVNATRGFINRWGEMILLVTIVLFLLVITAGADQIGVRYILPIFPLLYIWVSRIVPDFMTARSGTAVLVLLLTWHVASGIFAFPNYIPYFNELAGGAAEGPGFLDDSNVDWGQGLKEAADYVRRQSLGNVNIFFFNPFGGPGSEYYGLPKNIEYSEVIDRLVAHRPKEGTYIISSHFVIRMGHLNPAWKIYKPVDRIGESLWVYTF